MLFVILGIIAVIVLFVISSYNSIVTSKLKATTDLKQIQVQLQKRFDLIPNLVKSVSAYAKHEKGTLEAVIQARNTYKTASTPAEEFKASGDLTQALSKLMVLSERYPELKADKNFMDFNEKLSKIEGEIGYARQFYNDSANVYNTKIATFPGNVFAGMFGFAPLDQFDADETAQDAPEVNFDM